MKLSSPETLHQLSGCAESCLRLSCVSSVDLPRRKPACSRGSCGSTTGSMRLCINLSRTLNGTQSSEMGLYDLGSCAGLFGFGRPTTVARRQVFGSLDLRKHDVKNEHSQAVVFALWLMTNSGWMLSRPGALPDFNFFMAASSSSTVKSGDRLTSAVAALESEVTSRDVQRAKPVSACIWEASVIQKLRSNCICSYWTPRVRRASACQLVYGLPRLAT